MAGYKGGHILRIKVINFMTYDELEIFPKHGLNLVVGLNGSGKSSIMCAICLGLAGKPQFTGRPLHLSDFIKYGCDKATIEIELDNLSKRNIVIRRIIQGDKSVWQLNKNTVTLNEVQNTVKKFNIDIGNLCQFLPQEKVAEFAKMDKKARLENMLQAIGEPRLFQLFKELKEMKLDSLKLEEEMHSLQENKNAEGQKNERIKVDVDKQAERTNLKETLKTLLQNKKYLDYQELRQRSLGIKLEMQPLQTSIATQEQELAEINRKHKEKTYIIQANFEQIKQARMTSSVIQDKISESETKLSKFHEMAHNVNIHYQNKIAEKRNQVQKLAEIKQQKLALEKLVEKSRQECPKLKEENIKITQLLEEYKSHISKTNSSYAYINMEKNKLEYTIKSNLREIELLRNEENKRVEFLKQRFRDAYEAYIWLQQNTSRFKAQIHPPMLILLKIENEDNCKYIENLISQRDLVAFICEDREDNKLATQILIVQKKLKVNIVMAPNKPIEHYRTPPLTQAYRQMGILCFLNEIISAPEGVMRFLCECYNLHMIPICNSTGQTNMHAILQNFRSFFTPSARFSGKQSKYGNKNVSIRRDPIKGRKIIPSSKDHSDQLQELLAKSQAMQTEMGRYTNELKNLEEQRRSCEREENDYRERKRAVVEKLKEHEKYERQLVQKVESYERKKNEVIDEEAEKRYLTRKIQEINSQKSLVLMELNTLLEDFIRYKKQRLTCNLKARLLKKSMFTVQRLLKEREEQFKMTERQLDELRQNRSDIKEKGIELYNEILNFLSGKENHTEIQNKNVKSDSLTMDKLLSCSADSVSWQSNKIRNVDEYSIPSFSKSVEKKLNVAFRHHSKEEVAKEIRRTQAQLEISSEENEAVLHEYKQRQLNIAELETNIVTFQTKLKQLKVDIENKKNEWLPALSKHIKSINGKFSQYYKKLKCAGEISLDTCNNTDDFPKYGLQITLKYRDNEPFMELSSTHHSGGECSVAAIIFILSLQELTEVPFRCIDEINQGMDAQNERSMYNLIADNARSSSCSQYFLLTPKLLMDLEMLEHKDVSVHIIFNSSFLDINMDVQKHIELFDS